MAPLKNLIFGIHKIPVLVWFRACGIACLLMTFFWYLLGNGSQDWLEGHMLESQIFIIFGTLVGCGVWLEIYRENDNGKA